MVKVQESSCSGEKSSVAYTDNVSVNPVNDLREDVDPFRVVMAQLRNLDTSGPSRPRSVSVITPNEDPLETTTADSKGKEEAEATPSPSDALAKQAAKLDIKKARKIVANPHLYGKFPQFIEMARIRVAFEDNKNK